MDHTEAITEMPKAFRNGGSHLLHTFASGASPPYLRNSHMLKTTGLPVLLPHPFPSLVKQWEATESFIH